MSVPDPGDEGVVLRPASPSDLEAVLGLLEAVALPVAGVPDSLAELVVAEEAGELVGVVGLEVHGRDGLLRSVAVAPALRGRGLGGRLTRRALAAARDAELRRVYLLTTTAADYFPAHGFRRIARKEASAAVQESVEFREACPTSAVAMVLDLDGERAS